VVSGLERGSLVVTGVPPCHSGADAARRRPEHEGMGGRGGDAGLNMRRDAGPNMRRDAGPSDRYRT